MRHAKLWTAVDETSTVLNWSLKPDSWVRLPGGPPNYTPMRQVRKNCELRVME